MAYPQARYSVRDTSDALLASVDGGLDAVPFEMQEGAAATVVIASAGYPDSYETGKAITIDPAVNDLEGVLVFHAGTRLEGDALLTAGGRVLSVTACVGERRALLTVLLAAELTLRAGTAESTMGPTPA